jgi:DNA repair protein RecN (Recombination protein N)
MLIALSIRDVVLIDQLDLEFEPGLTAFTGETGAGKSILLDALGLALGARADAGLIRAGAAQSVVTAAFSLPSAHPAHTLLAEQGLGADDTVVLRRIVTRDGKSRALINDQTASLSLLRRIAETLIEIEGQHAALALAEPATQLRLLDQFGVPVSLRQRTAAAWRAWREAEAALRQARDAIEAARRDEEFLRHAHSELHDLAAQPDEEQNLASQRQHLQGAERRAAAIDAALSEIAPRERRSGGPAVTLRSAARSLSRLAETEPGSQAAQALSAIERAEEALSEAETLLSRASAEAAPDPRALDQIETRLFTLRAAARKYTTSVAELPALCETFAARLAALETSETAIASLATAADQARIAYTDAANALHDARLASARKLEAALARELPPLKLDRARFTIACTSLPDSRWSDAGMDETSFLVATNPGDTPGALDRVASGGELSRLMLALKVVLTRAGPADTLIFDEVDSGIGGATAAAVGERLARIAKATQVLMVTHSPQVAARAAHHFVVAKSATKNRAQTTVRRLDHAARHEEIARMLAGETITDAARAAAHSLLSPT